MVSYMARKIDKKLVGKNFTFPGIILPLNFWLLPLWIQKNYYILFILNWQNTNGLIFFLFLDPFADAIKGNDDDVQDGLVHIRIQQRNGRKTLTTVQGLSAEYDLKKIVRSCKKVCLNTKNKFKTNFNENYYFCF